MATVRLPVPERVLATRRHRIERGIVEYCGATLGSAIFVHESDTRVVTCSPRGST
nr:hypothetical protein JVH1_6824 [Rhodococcus sp. JVH1]